MLGWPGEQLIGKMWESLIDKGIGNLLRPRSIRADARARTTVKAEEIVLLAQAEAQADAIRRGEIDVIANPGKPLLFVRKDAPVLPTPETLAAADVDVARLAFRRIVADQIRREVNVSHAILNAETELESDTTDKPDKRLDSDWLLRWRDYAGDVSSDELQQLWGRLLAGETKHPGQYSLRTLDFVRNLSVADAKQIEKIAPLALASGGGYYIFRDDNALNEDVFPYSYWLLMDDFGILSGVETLKGSFTVTVRSLRPDVFLNHFLCCDRIILVKRDDAKGTFSIPVFKCTVIGKEILKLCKGTANDNYLKALGETIVRQGFQVEVGDHKITGDRVECSNMTPIVISPDVAVQKTASEEGAS